jgi:ketosteroid isomerase-like protein
MRATALFAGGQPYENEYSVWVQVQGGLIVRVGEYLDVAHATGQFSL